MTRKRPAVRGFAIPYLVRLLAIPALVACSADEIASPDAAEDKNAARPSLGLVTYREDLETRRLRTTLTTFAHGLATALREPSLRNALVRELRNSKYTTEHKLHVKRLLTRTESQLVRRIAQTTGQPVDSLVQRMNAVGDFELYMPVRAQRERYSGARDLLVTALVMEGEDLTAYSLDGDSLRLSHSVPPVRPVLVITRRETDFSTESVIAASMNLADNSEAIGTWRVNRNAAPAPSIASAQQFNELDPCSTPLACGDPVVEPPPPLPIPSSSAGLYLRQSEIYDAAALEEWGRGNPELVLRISRPPLLAFDGTQSPGAMVGCIHQKYTSADARYWDQDTRNWSMPANVRWAQILTSAQIDAITELYVNALGQFPIEIWEDDGGGMCDYEHANLNDSERAVQTARQLSTLYRAGSTALGCFATAQSAPILNIVASSAKKLTTVKVCPLWKAAQAAWGSLKRLNGEDDDFVGSVYPIGQTPPDQATAPFDFQFWRFLNDHRPNGISWWANYAIVRGRSAAAPEVKGFLRIDYLDRVP